jgi:gliding motility-associated-like protein
MKRQITMKKYLFAVRHELQKITLLPVLFLSMGIEAFGQIPNCDITATDYSICLGQTSSLSINTPICGYLPPSLQIGINGWYPFCGNTNDVSSNSNNGTNNGASLTTDINNYSNSAYSFNGSNNTIDIPNAFLNGAQVNQFTMNSRVYFNSLSNSPNIWGKTYFWGEVNLQVNNQGRVYLIWANSITGNKYSEIYTTNSVISANTWYDITVVFQSGTGQIYIDGVAVPTSLRWVAQGGSVLSTTTIENSCNFAQHANSSKFGVRIAGGSPVGYLNGVLDEFKIWNIALNASQIQQNYQTSEINTSWSDGTTNQTSIQVQPTQTTTYSVTVSDGVGTCTDSITILVNQPLNLLQGSDTISICGNNTSLDATNPAAASYSWNTGEITPSIIVSSSGEYHVTVTDTAGCSSSDSVYVSVIDLTITAGQSAFCLGDSTNLTVNDYPSSWWSDGTTNQTSIQVQPTQTTTYSVTVSDGVGSCTDSITIQVNNPQINAGPDISVCAGDSTTLTATGASTYAWDNGVVNGQAFVPTVEGYYNVTGTDTLGCSNSVSIFLDLLQPTSSSISPVNCVTYTAPDGAIYTNSGQYTAIIPNAAGCDSTISINLTINNASSGTDTHVACDSYTWIDGNTYTSSTNSATFVLPNANGCDSTVTLNLTINKLNGLNAGNDINACQGENITLSASGATSYNWSGGVINGVPFVPPAGTTIYTVTGTDDNGCTATDALTVLVEYCLDIPGGISPNGDNSNDTWTINGLNQYPDAKIFVFDRWGQKVFSGDATNPTWNGTYEGKELPTADYYYIIELGNGEKFNGVVTLKK